MAPRPALTPVFTRQAAEGEYWLVNDSRGRLPVVLIGGANAATPAAVVIPLDADFAPGLIVQSLNQIEKAYGADNSVLDNRHVRVSFATNDERTAKRVCYVCSRGPFSLMR